MERVDVAIVGGGPAGTSAAWTAAEAGADAVVLERGVPRTDRDAPGPDSTDAAGMLDYWIDIMEFDPGEIPEEVILAELDGADFVGPNESLRLETTTIEAAYDGFGFAFDRARFDDWLREEAEAAGAQYRVGDSVTGVDTDLAGEPSHSLSLSSGEEVVADALVLADGPQRTVTMNALDQFTPEDRSVASVLSPPEANHIAYQEHRRVPEELFEPRYLKFWWGIMPGHTAYPWIFPNDRSVARIGLTMPIGLDITDYDANEWALLREDDESIPNGDVYLRRLIEREFPDYDLEDFPLADDRGKRDGTETYPISSTRPIESPEAANVAVVGGAMGATSAFHEGGDHVAVRTGKIAGRLAAGGDLRGYNRAWQDAIGDEILRNVTMADLARDFGPSDWDRAFGAVANMLDYGTSGYYRVLRSGLAGVGLWWDYRSTKRQFRDGGYVQFRQGEYSV
ncbi:MAG: NAD(P)/FAD-dependent oxidoreductase [Haloarculaceae archaeon]